jgi:hypothetical protein
MNYDNGGNSDKMNNGVEELRKLKETAKQQADKRGGPMLIGNRITMMRQKRESRKMER